MHVQWRWAKSGAERNAYMPARLKVHAGACRDGAMRTEQGRDAWQAVRCLERMRVARHEDVLGRPRAVADSEEQHDAPRGEQLEVHLRQGKDDEMGTQDRTTRKATAEEWWGGGV